MLNIIENLWLQRFALRHREAKAVRAAVRVGIDTAFTVLIILLSVFGMDAPPRTTQLGVGLGLASC